MAKKKKKSSKGPSESSQQPKNKLEALTLPPPSPENEDDEEIFLELKLRRPSNKDPKANLKFDSDPVLSLEAQDAQRLKLRRKDRVLVFFKDDDRESKSMAGVLVCKVAIAKSSPGGSSGTPNRRASTSLGSCTLEPSFVVDSIFDQNDNPEKSQPASTKSALETPTPINTTTQQSTPTSGFSFAKGGGGDLLLTGSPAFSPSSYLTPQKAKPGHKAALTVWVVPWSSPLGQDAASVLCQDATKIHIQVDNDALSPSRLSTMGLVLKQLFLAQTQGRYIHAGCRVLPISFLGKSLHLQIQQIDAKLQAQKRSDLLLELEMESLELGDDEQDPAFDFEAQVWKRIREGLEDRNRARSLLLYKVGRDTNVMVSSTTQNKGGVDTTNTDTKDTTKDSETTPTRVVAGLSSTIEKVKRLLLRPILEPELFSQGSMKAPRGVLLYGNAGVGKTCLAKQITLDLEREHPGKLLIQSVNCASLQSYTGQVGEAERRIVRVFEKVSMTLSDSANEGKIGALLVFDDIHFVCPKRSGYNAGADRLTATLLGLLDGIGSASSKHQTALGGAISNGIVILGTTTDPSKLDPALRRPGRLDFEVELPGPDNAQARAEILKFHLCDIGKDYTIPSFTDEEYLELGGLAKGFNGADCMLAVKEGIRTGMVREQQTQGTSDQTSEHPSTGKKLSGIHNLQLTDLKMAIRATKPTAIKSITLEIPKVPWSSIGGMDYVKEELQEAIEMPEIHREYFERLRIPAPRGILLYGPPGCSKTLMARALATEGKMNFLAVKGPELLSKWLGESERALASLFRRARNAAPSIIFFDEIDAIATDRGSDISSGGGRLLSQLLTELDGIHSSGGVTIGNDTKNPRVVVVAATNRPDLIDSALMRPGRIDKKIYVGPPDEKSRHRIFEIGLRNRNCADDIDISHLAKEEVSGGYSGAELIAVCKDGAWLALEEDEATPSRNELPSLRMSHLVKAINTMKPQITPEMIEFYEGFRRQNKR